MKIVAINGVNFGSTGNIMLQIGKLAEEKGDVFYPCFPDSRSNGRKKLEKHVSTGGRIQRNLHIKFAEFTGFHDCFSAFATRKFIKALEKIGPDIIHLHNLHGDYVNLAMLFRYIKKHNIPVVWTLHDCWSFTGQCPYFDMAACDKWKTGCHHCPQTNEYPSARVDNTSFMWKKKRKWFSGVENLTIVTPSQWLADLVKQSYLKDYPVKVINNGIDLSVFKPIASNFREKYGIHQDKFVLLGVAFGWGIRKGLDVFIELAKRLDDRFQIVLVGTDEVADKLLPDNIISINRTQNQKELAEIYTAADLFVNPTREDNYPTVNMEALACGTPVLTFNTGGSPEPIFGDCGSVVEKNDIDAMAREIIQICNDNPFPADACFNRAKGSDMNKRFEEYINLYKENTCSKTE